MYHNMQDMDKNFDNHKATMTILLCLSKEKKIDMIVSKVNLPNIIPNTYCFIFFNKRKQCQIMLNKTEKNRYI